MNYYNLTVNEAIFTIIDIEATGFTPENNSIIEVAGIKYQGGVVIDKFSSLVKPEYGFLPSHITDLTGITNALVIDQPEIETVLGRFFKFIDDSILVGHNVKFDIAFLNEKGRKFLKKQLKNPFICTDSLARRLYPDIESKSLSSLAAYMGVPVKRKHRAMADAEATLQVFQKMLDYLQDYNITKVIDIIKLSQGKKINHKNKRRRYV